jgi:integrase
MMIMALTGARDAEIAYASSDLYYLKDIPCIDLRKSGTKTQNSPRLIPVLPQLQQVGFLEWAKRQQAKGRSLVESPTGVISVDAWSKRGNRYLRQVGYTDKALVLYSFRHTFRQVLRTSGLHPEIVNRIFGHETGEVGSGYGSNLSYEEAKLFMDKVKYPVFLDHLADRNGTFLW